MGKLTLILCFSVGNVFCAMWHSPQMGKLILIYGCCGVHLYEEGKDIESNTTAEEPSLHNCSFIPVITVFYYLVCSCTVVVALGVGCLSSFCLYVHRRDYTRCFSFLITGFFESHHSLKRYHRCYCISTSCSCIVALFL